MAPLTGGRCNNYCLYRYFELVRDLRHNKGQILKASVDYIRRLKLDADANKEAEAKRRALEQQNRQLHLRIQVCAGYSVHSSHENYLHPYKDQAYLKMF